MIAKCKGVAWSILLQIWLGDSLTCSRKNCNVFEPSYPAARWIRPKEWACNDRVNEEKGESLQWTYLVLYSWHRARHTQEDLCGHSSRSRRNRSCSNCSGCSYQPHSLIVSWVNRSYWRIQRNALVSTPQWSWYWRHGLDYQHSIEWSLLHVHRLSLKLCAKPSCHLISLAWEGGHRGLLGTWTPSGLSWSNYWQPRAMESNHPRMNYRSLILRSREEPTMPPQHHTCSPTQPGGEEEDRSFVSRWQTTSSSLCSQETSL